MRALLVHNANAGTDPEPRAEIEAELHNAGFHTSYCAHGEDDLSAALQTDYDFVIAAGGDGTVSHVVSAHEHVDRPIAILPLGGSNNIATALGISEDWRASARSWSLDRWVLLDRCEADGPWGKKNFIEALGSGALTEAFAKVDEEPDTDARKRANGREAFRMALEEAAPFRCCIEADGWEWDEDCLMVEVMNMSLVGSRLALAGDAAPGDGVLDIIIVSPDQRQSMVAWARDPDASPCPIAPRRAAALRMTVDERPFRLDDRSPDEKLSGTVDIRVRTTPVRILTNGHTI